jgi:hypothetical protein
MARDCTTPSSGVWARLGPCRPEPSRGDLRHARGDLAAWPATRAAVRLPSYTARRAAAGGPSGHAVEGLTLLTAVLSLAHHTGASWPVAGLYRLQGDLLLALSAENHTKAVG